MSYAKALQKAQCESVHTTIRKRRLLFAGVVQRAKPERLTRRAMFGTMDGGENPGPGRPGKTWARCLVDDIAVFRARKGSTELSPLLFGVETVQWPTASKRAGKLFRGVVKAEDGFRARWHRAEVEKSWLRHANEVTEKGEKGKREEGARGGQP